jgi:dTDP-glucose 4,6-dehydratase
MSQTILITWWAWFIWANFLNIHAPKHPDIQWINCDALTYAWNHEKVNESVRKASNYHFHQCDVNDIQALEDLYTQYEITDCIHFAAESHVDNSIENPWIFLQTNILGTNNILLLHKKYQCNRFHYVGTDEVYGDLPLDQPEVLFTEKTPLNPHSPYSVSKAWGDMLTHAFARTYGIDTVITRCSNNYWPHQDTEKLIPRFISLLIEWKNVPLYGDGKNVRDWLYVWDHCEAIREVFMKWKSDQVYNIWWNNEYSNREITDIILWAFGKWEECIVYVEDRKWHDRRYAIDNTKITKELERSPSVTFEEWIVQTIQRYKASLS